MFFICKLTFLTSMAYTNRLDRTATMRLPAAGAVRLVMQSGVLVLVK